MNQPTSIPTDPRPLRLGTRGSLLARSQSQLVADLLMSKHPGLSVQLVIVQTTGDRLTDRPLRDVGGKGLFTKELELALLARKVDFAVHSYKDVPVTEPLVAQEDLVIASVPLREDPRDALVAAGVRRFADLPKGAKVGTSSLRRRCQLLATRADLKIEMLRGNVDTRLRKQREGQYDAVILAVAGLRRTNLFDSATMSPLAADEMLPAAAQGALALQCRRDDRRSADILRVLHDDATALCVGMERNLVRELAGDCHSPIAALAQLDGDRLTFSAAVGARDGEPPVIRTTSSGTPADTAEVLSAALADLRRHNVVQLLRG